MARDDFTFRVGDPEYSVNGTNGALQRSAVRGVDKRVKAVEENIARVYYVGLFEVNETVATLIYDRTMALQIFDASSDTTAIVSALFRDGGAIISDQVEHLDKGWITRRKAIALSVFAFLLLGAWFLLDTGTSPLRRIAIVAGVIFFHELGHLLAMKLCRYRPAVP